MPWIRAASGASATGTKSDLQPCSCARWAIGRMPYTWRTEPSSESSPTRERAVEVGRKLVAEGEERRCDRIVHCLPSADRRRGLPCAGRRGRG